ncbi:cobalt-precorrin-5B (C(1))-methyltransferase CbiD [Clostridium weizhouense]|uniref:Cobalt-precorrin-5B C(1)-methyltransferase n=1 Tax=Clostridium weizhouense TaxID=2859781 RepID=A0ABS7AKZ6_9CLOT|nr:cobalt-precorrin-5B (C(1))-methyltransferase CbiD [Clostridium weizhouense]MBW6409234.1 cobalt-precorrin-5B (C(1))-methyltransferase CbiD [Clostridium weizhouense]
MFQMYVDSGGKKLRCGYTTGACATGSSKAATMLLFNKIKDEELNEIEIDTPKGIKVQMPIDSIFVGEDFVECTILKFSGDDKDITMGIEIKAKVQRVDKEDKSIFSEGKIINESKNIILEGGVGVGKVTKEGLFVAKGEPAINPVPREMIIKEVEKILPKDECVRVIISVPQGVEIGKKTFNPRLGIEGGISILGTSGIVYPMSEDALKASIKLEIKQKALNNKRLILTFGNLGENYCKALGYKEDEIVICSNFIGFALESCVSYKVKEVIIVGHIGKMCKIAYGCFNTHSRVCGVRLEVIALELALLGFDISLIEKILEQKTCEGAVKFLGEGYSDLYKNMGTKILNKMQEYVYDELKVDGVMYYGASTPTLLWSSLN